MKVHRSNGGPPRVALRLFRLVATGVAAAALASAGVAPASADDASSATVATPRIQIFYRSPVLVRRGERVHIPVDVVCIRNGAPCAARVRLSLDGPRVRSASAPADPGLAFDLTGPARRAAGGRLDFTLSAASGETGSASLPDAGQALHVYVASRMPSITLPAIPFGTYRPARTVLFLPWGSSEADAGLSAGEEGETLGPSSFAIGPDGTIEVADAFHQRIVEFRAGRLIAALQLAMSPQTDLAVGSDGSTFVASDEAIGERRTRYTTLDAGGDIESFRTVPGDMLDQVAPDGSSAYAHVLPLDAWVPFPGSAESPPEVDTGLPLPTGGMLLRSVVGDSVRLGIASGSAVTGAVELQSPLPLGDLAFAAPYGQGGYVAVVRVVGAAGDQYEVAQIGRDGSVAAFAVPSHQFAATLPASQFRLGPDGALYQMTTSPDGVRIVRYAMGGNR